MENVTFLDLFTVVISCETEVHVFVRILFGGLSGADKLVNYADVLQDVRYVNLRPEDLNSRTFVLTCTELNGRFVSNEMKVTVSVWICLNNGLLRFKTLSLYQSIKLL